VCYTYMYSVAIGHKGPVNPIISSDLVSSHLTHDGIKLLCIVMCTVICDKNKRGFSGFNEGVYLNPCRDYTQQK
jgi:hypothetical protein